MAVPPPHIITRRLIKKFFRNHPVKQQRALKINPLEELGRCWNKMGYGHPECQKFLDDYEKLLQDRKLFEREVQDFGLPKMVRFQLQKPKYKHQKKGKWKDALTGSKLYNNTFFDGIK